MAHARHVRITASVAVLAVLGAACSDTEGADSSAETASAADGADSPNAGPAGGEVSLQIAEPERLVTLDVSESEGIAVLKALYTPLITYDPVTGESGPGVADSITTSDGGKTWTVTLTPGWTFHNGEPVTAASFVDAWNEGAYGPSAHRNAGYFADIEGFDALNPRDTEQEPTLDELSGLRQIDELTFEVVLSQPQPTWSSKLGYPAYAPLPPAYFDDPEGFEEQPIGNGPFRMAEPWAHDQAIRVERWEDWPGAPLPNVDGLEFAIYAEVDTAVTDLLAGNLDVVVDVPAGRWPDVRDQMGADQTLVSPTSSVTFLGFPLEADTFAGDRGREIRTAMSLAIDQEAIVAAIFSGTEAPAHNLLPPVIPGYEEEVCPAWGTDEDRARELYEEAGPIEAPLTVWFNSGGGQQEWIEAAVGQWRDVLGIEDVSFESLQPADYLPRLTSGSVEGPFRLGWSMDYPSPQNFLEPLLASWMLPERGGANVFRYADEDYDATLEQALSSTDEDDALAGFQEAVRIACEDVPLVPVYYGQELTAYGDDVANVRIDPFGHVDYLHVTTAAN